MRPGNTTKFGLQAGNGKWVQIDGAGKVIANVTLDPGQAMSTTIPGLELAIKAPGCSF